MHFFDERNDEWVSLNAWGNKEPLGLRTKSRGIKIMVRMQSNNFVSHARSVKYILNIPIPLPDYLPAMWCLVRAVYVWYGGKVDAQIENWGTCLRYSEGQAQSLGPGSILVTVIHPDKNAFFRGPNYVKAQDGPCYQLLSDWLLWLWHHKRMPVS